MMNREQELLKLSQDYPIILFDGECILCNSSINWLIKWDSKKQLRYATLQSSHPDQVNYDTVKLLYKNQVFEKAKVWDQLVNILGGRWWVLKPLTILPLWILNPLYDLIARNRFRWFGKKESCRIPSAEEKELFI